MTLDEAIKHCEEKSCGNNACALEHKQLAEWLKELKELQSQSRWKPSDEQMKALNEAEGIVGTLTPRGKQLNSLYKNLKKLKG